MQAIISPTKMKSRSFVSVRKKSKVDDMNFGKIQIQDYTGVGVLGCINLYIKLFYQP